MAQTQDRPVLSIERHYEVAPEKVWRAWTEPQALTRWFGPGNTECVTDAQLDVRPGGRYSIAFRTADGESHRVSGTYEEVEPCRRLRFTWAWQSTPDRVSLVTVDLAPKGAGTDMSFRHERFFDRAARDNHEQGWTATLEKLAAFLAT
jgi:uncharacterized protein YndB with AHSA1/START domain